MSDLIVSLIEHLFYNGDSEGLQILKKAIDDENLKGFSIVDDPNADIEDDAAAEWLRSQESKSGKSQPARGSRKWSPPENIKEEHKPLIEKYLSEGFSPREAHRLAGAHREESDFQRAMKSGIRPSPMSDKMLSLLKPLAKEWVENAAKQEMQSADITKNPVKYAAGQLSSAFEKHGADYHHALNEFLSSDALKDLKGMARHKAVREWKKQWHAEHPEYTEKMKQVASQQKLFDEAKEAAKKNLNERIQHIATGGLHEAGGVSATEAAQHLGQEVRGEPSESPSLNVTGESASFARKNPKLMEILQREQFKPIRERMKLVDNHAKVKGVIRKPKSEGGENQ